MHTEPVSILLVEDDEIDVEGVRRGLRKLKIANPLAVAGDGLEALEILRGTNGRQKLKAPFVILLDLNMPRMNGFEFLEEIRRDEALHQSVIFILTTSAAERDLVQAYEHHIAGYMVKDAVGESFIEAMALLDHFWRIVELPAA